VLSLPLVAFGLSLQNPAAWRHELSVTSADYSVLALLSQVDGRRELRAKDDAAPGIVDVGPALFSQPKVCLLAVIQQHIRSFTTMCYINLCFTYLLTYLHCVCLCGSSYVVA